MLSSRTEAMARGAGSTITISAAAISALLLTSHSLALLSTRWEHGRVGSISSAIALQMRMSRAGAASQGASKLLPDPLPNSLGNFFENSTDSMSFIQCYMISVGAIDNGKEIAQYGVGAPVDMPVMLTYFEDNELKPVQADYPDYDHLINHVAVQMDNNDFQLYKTPVVLTLQGEFEEEEEEEEEDGMGEVGDDDEEGVYGDDDEEEELSLEQLLLNEDEDDEDDEDKDEEDEDEEDEEDEDNKSGDSMSSFWSASPAGRAEDRFGTVPDYALVKGSGSSDGDAVPESSLVTDEDSKALRKAHRKADRIIEYATDISLIASFHYKKRNFHLVKLLEPILIIGKRITDIKGYYFTLLNDEESSVVRPVLEQLLILRKKAATVPGAGSDVSSGRRRPPPSPLALDDEHAPLTTSGDGASGAKKSRRRWITRRKD